MLSSIALRIVDFFIERNQLPQDKKAHYVYGVTIRIEQTVFTLLAWLLGVVFGVWKESIVLILILKLLRSHTGGFHIKSYGACLVCSVGIVMAGYILLPYVAQWNALITGIAVAVSCIVIWVNAPVNHPSYAGNGREMAYHKRKCRLYVLACGAAAVACLPFGITRLYAVYAAYALAVVAGLVLLAKLAGQELAGENSKEMVRMKLKETAMNIAGKLIQHDAKLAGIGWPPCMSFVTHQPVRPCAVKQELNLLEKDPKSN